jgi:hypothetical protein
MASLEFEILKGHVCRPSMTAACGCQKRLKSANNYD